MVTFQKVKLGDVITVKGGKRLPIGHELTKNITAHPYIRARDIGEGKITFDDPVYVNEDTFPFIKNYIVHKNDVCITIVGANVGDIGFVPAYLDGANLTENAVKLFPENNDFDKGFLKYCLLTNEIKLQMQQLAGGGAAQPKLGLYKINKLEIPHPTIKDQTRIVSVLSAYDDLIENNEKRIKALEEMAQLLYTEWFVKFKFPGHEKVKMVDSDTECGVIPDGWRVKRLADVVIPQYGYTASAEEDNDYPKYLRGTDINKNSFIDWMHVPNCKVSDDDFKKYKIRKGDIFIIRMADPGKIGICEREVEAVFASYLMRLNIKSNLTPYYLYYFVTSRRYQGFVLGASGGTTRKSVNSEQIGAIDVLIPKQEILDNFEAKVSLLREELTKLIQQNNFLSKTRDLLIPQLVTGKRILK